MEPRLKTTSIAQTFAVAIAASMLSMAPTHAYVDIELDSGSHVKGESYFSEGDRIMVYRPGGAIEVDRAKVRAIREVEGSLNDTVAPAQPSAAAPSTMAPSAAAKIAPALPAALPETKDPKQRDNELSHQLMHMRLDRLAASQRGDEETMKKLDKEIGSLQKERIKNYKKIDPSFEVEASK
jgi:hypothetical protein